MSKYTFDKKSPGIIGKLQIRSNAGILPSSFREIEKIEDRESRIADREAAQIRKEMDLAVDDITRYLRKKYNLPSMGVYNNYTNGNFPINEYSNIMSVSRYYAPINICVDLIPKDWPEGKIQAKKWSIEQIGYKYMWVVAEEDFIDDATFLQRLKPLDTKPIYEIKPFILIK